jgi:hypothetical protein
LRGPRSRHCTPAAPTLPTDINGLPPWAPLPPPAVLVVANCAFCQTDQPSTVPCPVKINDLQHERIGKIERDITALKSRHSFPSTRRRTRFSRSKIFSNRL